MLLPAVGVMAFLGTSAGCLVLNSSNHRLAVSPDGAFAAYIHSEKAWVIYGGHDGIPLGGKKFVRWRRVEGLFAWTKSVKVDSYTGEAPTGYIADTSPRIKFSPDSRHLGVLVRGVLSCIDLETARMWAVAPPDERVTTFAWSGPDEVDYVDSPQNRVFYRHSIADPPDVREVIDKNAGPAIQGIFSRASTGLHKGGSLSTRRILMPLHF